MFAVTRSLGRVAGLALLMAMQPVVAQEPVAYQLQNVGDRSACPVEPHRKAINPDVIACHARFAPLPAIPPEINTGNAEHLEVLRSQGDDFLRQLDRPDACGRSAKVRVTEACAILVYAIDPEFRQAGLPWTYVVKIYRASRPPERSRRDTVLLTVMSNNSEARFGPSAVDGEVWQLLADQRVKRRCVPGMDEFKRGTRSAFAGFAKRPDTCRQLAEDVRYRPVLLIGRGEAQRVLSPASIKYHFESATVVKD